LNIGLCGSLAWRIPGKWKTNPNAYPVRHLYLDLLAERGDGDDSGEQYRFEFLTEARVASSESGECWYKVADILSIKTPTSEMIKWLNERLPQEKVDVACVPLDKLYQVIHNKNLLSYYEEKSQDLEKVLNIFIRMNSGGTVLSYSDLLLSVAVAQWSGDARKEIYALVDEINNTGDGFSFSKDLILKAGLMLADIGSVGFKVENFNRENMEILEKRWPDIKTALTLATQLVASFGFNGKTLRADSALLPIAYYISHRNFDSSYLSKSCYDLDRQSIRIWVIRSLLKVSGIWGSGLDTLLTALREAIKKHGAAGFPAPELQDMMAKRGKSLRFEEEEIDELAEMQYGDKRLFAFLTLLFPFVDVTNHHFHVDHIFPRSQFTKPGLTIAGIAEDDIDELKERANSLPNLQLLEGGENIEKQASMPAAWMASKFSDSERAHYCNIHMLGKVPEKLAAFDEFYVARREMLRSRIIEVLAARSGEAG